jgi:hypothetical protein
LVKEFQSEAPFFIPFFYIYQMETETLRQEIIAFFENIQKYYGSKTEITQGLFSDLDNLDAKLTAWNLSEFELARSAYRNNGGKFMLEGTGSYFEISAEKIIDFKKTGRNKFEFIEQYSQTVFRITKIRFHYKY